MIYADAQVKIPFHDIDIMEIAWHGHYVKYFEIARCELLDKLDYDHERMRDSGYAWPVIDMHLRYARPARYNQVLNVRARLSELEHRLKIDYTVTDAETGERLTRGHTVQVAVDIASGEMCFASPQVLLDKIENHQEDPA